MIPYTEDFAKLKQEFYNRSFRDLSDSEFWTVVVNVAKKGGVRGKTRDSGAPALAEQHQDILEDLIPFPIGQRDRLPYTEAFDRLVKRFNQTTNLDLTHREIWLSILKLAK